MKNGNNHERAHHALQDRQSLLLHQEAVQMLAADPSLSAKALEILTRWDSTVSSSSKPLRDRWVEIIIAKDWSLALEESERGNQLRQASPLAILLPEDVRLQILQNLKREEEVQKMTLTEFMTWEEHQTERHEFFRGETFAMVGGTARHNRVILNLASRIGDHLDGTTCQVFAENMKVQIPDGVLYPDVMVTCSKAEAGDEQTVTDPKLIIEVLSPSTRGYDQRDKFILYRTLPSLREYVLIDPAQRQVEVFTWAEGGTWTLTDQTAADALTLASIECKLDMALVFKGVASEAQ